MSACTTCQVLAVANPEQLDRYARHLSLEVGRLTNDLLDLRLNPADARVAELERDLANVNARLANVNARLADANARLEAMSKTSQPTQGDQQ